MRLFVAILFATTLAAQTPILYQRGAVNAASLVPFGLPNSPIARGSAFSIFGENLGPAQSPTLAFPLATTLGGVSVTVTQGATVSAVYPTFVSPGQINAILPSTVTAGLATLRVTNQSLRSNAITIQIADSAPGLFAVSSGGFGPGIVQNFLTPGNQPINSMTVPATRGQVITLWGTGLGPVSFADNIAPTAGDVAAPVSVTIGGRPAAKAYSGRTPCCAGIDQIVVTVPDDAPLGCWVPVLVKAGGAVSNTVTMAIAAPGATACDDPCNPLSALARGSGTQAFIHFERIDSVDNLTVAPAATKTLDKLYSRFYTRPSSPYAFDPYLSFPPAGSCLVHQTSGDAYSNKSLRGALPSSASVASPKLAYSNGTQSVDIASVSPYFSSTLGGTIGVEALDIGPLGDNGQFTLDPGGPNQAVFPLKLPTAPVWARPNGLLAIPLDSPFALSFTGSAAAPTLIVVYSYSAATNSTSEVLCLAPLGATSFTIPADVLANLPASYGKLDGSFTTLSLGTVGMNTARTFNTPSAANGLLLMTNWLMQSVVLQ